VGGLEPLGRAMGFGWRVTYSHVERLDNTGLVERIYDRGGSAVAITRRGTRLLDATPGEVRASSTQAFGLIHSRAVSWVAAYLTLRGARLDPRAGVASRGAVESACQSRHAPSGSRVGGGWAARGDRAGAAVEGAATASSHLARLEAAIADGRLAGVTYVARDDAVMAGVQRAAASAGERRLRGTSSRGDPEPRSRAVGRQAVGPGVSDSLLDLAAGCGAAADQADDNRGLRTSRHSSVAETRAASALRALRRRSRPHGAARRLAAVAPTRHIPHRPQGRHRGPRREPILGGSLGHIRDTFASRQPPETRKPRGLRGFLDAPERIRTSDLRFRRPTLYPAELRAQVGAADQFSRAVMQADRAGFEPAMEL
jgi:hypothetical protein